MFIDLRFPPLYYNPHIILSLQVIPLKSLKTDYQEYEARRNLAQMYEVFLADSRIARFLASNLGKAFLSRGR